MPSFILFVSRRRLRRHVEKKREERKRKRFVKKLAKKFCSEFGVFRSIFGALQEKEKEVDWGEKGKPSEKVQKKIRGQMANMK